MIHVYKDFISDDDAKELIGFIDDNLDSFVYNEERLRYMLRFGYDEELPDQAIHSMDIVNPIKPLLVKIFDKTLGIFEHKEYLTSWFLSKQIPGAKLLPHKDGAKGINDHLDYTAMLYLNSLDDNGIISFPELDISILPERGDLVVFKSLEHEHMVSEVTENRYSLPMWFTTNQRLEFSTE